MSQYKISKKRLAEIIKEEYQDLNENNALAHAKAGRADAPAHLTVSRMIESGDLDGAIETLTTMREAKAELAMNRQDEELKGDQKKLDADEDGDIDGKDMAALRDKKNLKKESLDSIRDLIQQELKNL
jgi:hypothetical protein